MSSSMSSQIEKRKQKDPNDIDEMPIQAGNLHRHKILRELPNASEQCQHEYQNNANRDVDCVEAGQGKVNPEKQFSVGGVRPIPAKIKSWDQMFHEIFAVLEPFNRHEENSE